MSRYGPRIAALERRAERERAALEASARAAGVVAEDDGCATPNGAPDGSAVHDEPERYLREGAGRAVWLYVEGRTGGRTVPFSSAELAALENAMNRWLECYARRHGVDLEAAFSVREAAELLVQTRNVHDVGRLLTGVPPRN